jgi:hypothetical protein
MIRLRKLRNRIRGIQMLRSERPLLGISWRQLAVFGEANVQFFTREKRFRPRVSDSL